MKIVARLSLLVVGLVVATAAYSHAASENGFPFGFKIYSRTALNGAALEDLADRRFRAETNRQGASAQAALPPVSAETIELARASFAVDPLAVTSLRTIALGELSQTDAKRGRQLMRLAARISRRDPVTNLWLAQDYGRAGEVEPMLASFDHALRTSRAAREFAMQPLVGTLASDESHVPLGRLLARHPAWEYSFWREFVRNPASLANSGEFFAASGIAVSDVPEEHRLRLYSGLRRAGLFENIARLAALDPRAKTGRDSLAAGEFLTAEEGNPFGWTVYSRGTYATGVSAGGRELEISAQPGSFGKVADRLARISGRQELSMRLFNTVPSNARIELTVRCADAQGQTLARLPIQAGEKSGTTTFEAGACRYATLELTFAVDQGRRDASIRIERAKLGPA